MGEMTSESVLLAEVVSEFKFFADRTRCVFCKDGASASSPKGDFVAHVASNALRGQENVSFSVASMAASHLGLPLVVFVPILSHCYPEGTFTARRLTFLMEGLKDMASEIEDLSQGKVKFFCLCTTKKNQKPLHLTLAAKARLIVTDEPFVEPHKKLRNQLADACRTEMWCCDSSCLAPIYLQGKAFSRAFQFENAVKKARASSLAACAEAFKKAKLADRSFDAENDSLLFLEVENTVISGKTLIGMTEETLKRFVQQHDTADQGVPPVPHLSKGGSRFGYERWREFKSKGLKVYDRRRNDPMLHFSGTSRISAFLNLGFISPFRIAREISSEPRNGGAAKFLDEFYKWRGQAYNHAFYSNEDARSHRSLPQWARRTFAEHAGDPRVIHTLNDLDACRSESDIWNAMQKFLERTGELHNNARMAWGKAIVAWSDSIEGAWGKLVLLNDRYALDGLAPPSYAGLGWCLGLFDAPSRFGENSIFGKIRPKNIKAYRKLNLAVYNEMGEAQKRKTEHQPSIEGFFSPAKRSRKEHQS